MLDVREKNKEICYSLKKLSHDNGMKIIVSKIVELLNPDNKQFLNLLPNKEPEGKEDESEDED
ncbi:MAG: hypothetical protein WBZ36_12565 [Candidatus Nitrosopolaris sp.]